MSHLTALDRRALAFMKANNATTARSKRKTWTLEQIDGRAILRTRWTETDDWGRRIERTSRAEVQL